MFTIIRRLLDSTPNQAFPDAPSQPVADARVIPDSTLGSGIFGKWTIDADGLPAYDYQLDQYQSTDARYQNSMNLDRRDHWYAIGNDRITALASNDGTLQVFMADRGGVFLNRFDDGAGPDDWLDTVVWLPEFIRNFVRRIFQEIRRRQLEGQLQAWRATHPTEVEHVKLADENRSLMDDERTAKINKTSAAKVAHSKPAHFAGGYAYLDDGTETWATAYRYRPSAPKAEKPRRVFGLGYFETESNYRGVRVIRRSYAPFGDDPILLTDVLLRNLTQKPITLRYYEFWDVNLHQVAVSWFQTGALGLAASDQRKALMGAFSQAVDWDDEHGVLRASLSIETPPKLPDEPSREDWYPADIFLIDLDDHADDEGRLDLDARADGVYTDKAYFFGDEADPKKPRAVRMRLGSRLLDETGALDQPFCLVQRRTITLQPDAIRQLRFGYGAVKKGRSLNWVQKYRKAPVQKQTSDTWKKHLAYFSTGSHPALTREMVWHSYALQANAVYSEFFEAHVIAQGSAYLYLHGLDGVPRDQALFAMPLAYLRPTLAKESLRLIMSQRRSDNGYLSYAFAGHGVLEGVLIHNLPSDLDIFLLMAAVEYLAATGDHAFLGETVPFYPRGSRPAGVTGETVLDHLRYAFQHLISPDGVGIGANGLIKVGDGDWSDSVVFSTWVNRIFTGLSHELSVKDGESIPNTQMAVYVLTLFADQIEAHDTALASDIRAVLPGLKDAVRAQFTSAGWYTRAILRNILNGEEFIDQHEINLEAQPWALISGQAAEDDHEAILIDAIYNRLDRPSPTGPLSTVADGEISAAIGQLLTWGYSRSRPDLAWALFRKMSFTNRAIHFPKIWYGIWTAPDSLKPEKDGHGKLSEYPGGTWISPMTPMRDFPALNSNPHAMSLLSLIRLVGIEPFHDGLRIAPRIPKESFTLDMPLIKVVVDQAGISAEYHPVASGRQTFYIELPTGVLSATVTLDGQPFDAENRDGYLILPISMTPEKTTGFRVIWGRSQTRSNAPFINPASVVRM